MCEVVPSLQGVSERLMARVCKEPDHVALPMLKMMADCGQASDISIEACTSVDLYTSPPVEAYSKEDVITPAAKPDLCIPGLKGVQC